MTAVIVLVLGAAYTAGVFMAGVVLATRAAPPQGRRRKSPAREVAGVRAQDAARRGTLAAAGAAPVISGTGAARPPTALVTPPGGFPVPGGRHAPGAPRRSPSRADLPAYPAVTEDAPPWDIPTTAMPAVNGAAADRARYIAAYLREHGATPDVMREAMERAHACGDAPAPTAPEAERLAQVMTP